MREFFAHSLLPDRVMKVSAVMQRVKKPIGPRCVNPIGL